jgi:hypothetical protein
MPLAKNYKRVTPLGSFIFADLTPEGSHVSSHLVPGGNIFSSYHLVPGGNIFFTIWSMTASFFFVPFGPWRQKYYFNLSIRIGVPFYIRFQNFLKIQCIPL